VIHTATADVFIALKLATSRPDLEFGELLSYRESVTFNRTKKLKPTKGYQTFFQEWMG
jgi:hypothetical protein